MVAATRSASWNEAWLARPVSGSSRARALHRPHVLGVLEAAARHRGEQLDRLDDVRAEGERAGVGEQEHARATVAGPEGHGDDRARAGLAQRLAAGEGQAGGLTARVAGGERLEQLGEAGQVGGVDRAEGAASGPAARATRAAGTGADDEGAAVGADELAGGGDDRGDRACRVAALEERADRAGQAPQDDDLLGGGDAEPAAEHARRTVDLPADLAAEADERLDVEGARPPGRRSARACSTPTPRRGWPRGRPTCGDVGTNTGSPVR